MKLNNTLKILFVLLVLIVFSPLVLSVQQLISFQGKVDYLGELVGYGDIEVTIWDNATGGNLLYNSTDDFYGSVFNGYFDVMLGSITPLDLNYNQY